MNDEQVKLVSKELEKGICIKLPNPNYAIETLEGRETKYLGSGNLPLNTYESNMLFKTGKIKELDRLP